MEISRRQKQPGFTLNWKHTLAIWLSIVVFTMFMGQRAKTVAMHPSDKDREILTEESKAVIADVKVTNDQEGKK